jgi:hypothetical protein
MDTAPSCCGSGSRHEQRSTQRPRVIDVFQQHGLTYLTQHSVSAEQRRALRDLSLCRTEALGGNRRTCPKCGYTKIHYNSCRNRHCPSCRSLFRATWLSARVKRFLPVPHFLITFTLPEPLRAIAQQNPRAVYAVMFAAVNATVRTLARSELGGTMGVMAALHTWTRELHYHPHVHALVTAGALIKGNRWQATSLSYLFPHRRVAAIFRKHMLQGLFRLYDDERLEFRGEQGILSESWAFKRLIRTMWKTKFVVDLEAPPAGARPERALKYLARYAQGVAISDQRMVSSHGESITFKTRDGKRQTVSVEEFIRRYLLHVLPRGFNKLRYYGLYASRAASRLAQARDLVPTAPASSMLEDQTPLCELETWEERVLALTGIDPLVCPVCGCRPLQSVSIPSPRSSRNTS